MELIGKQIKMGEGIKLPTYVGGYRLGNDTYHTQFNFTHKPNWFHRTMMRLCFGLEWVNL
jgi:hypothetical protein